MRPLFVALSPYTRVLHAHAVVAAVLVVLNVGDHGLGE